MGNENCLEGERLCTSRRVQRDHKAEQEYLDKHNPRRLTLVEIALFLLVAVLAFDTIRSGASHRQAPPPNFSAPASAREEADHPVNWQSYGYDADLRR